MSRFGSTLIVPAVFSVLAGLALSLTRSSGLAITTDTVVVHRVLTTR
jgi:hypothetical protein